MRKTSKRTLKEIAKSIIDEGILDGYYSSVFTKYYDAFGQRWKITFSTLGNLKSVEQVDRDGRPIKF